MMAGSGTTTPFFALSALKYETSVRKEPQKQNITSSILHLEGALLKNIYWKLLKKDKNTQLFPPIFEYVFSKEFHFQYDAHS